jgi:hypothetical protein
MSDVRRPLAAIGLVVAIAVQVFRKISDGGGLWPPAVDVIRQRLVDRCVDRCSANKSTTKSVPAHLPE